MSTTVAQNLSTESSQARQRAEALATTAHDDQRLTALAAAAYIASAGYDEALRMPNPTATLDDMCDALDDVWAEIMPNLPKRFAANGPEIAETMRVAVADRLWAFTAIEYARAEAAAYNVGYLFDFLVEKLRAGADPHAIRTDALAAPRRIRELAEAADREGRE